MQDCPLRSLAPGASSVVATVPQRLSIPLPAGTGSRRDGLPRRCACNMALLKWPRADFLLLMATISTTVLGSPAQPSIAQHTIATITRDVTTQRLASLVEEPRLIRREFAPSREPITRVGLGIRGNVGFIESRSNEKHVTTNDGATSMATHNDHAKLDRDDVDNIGDNIEAEDGYGESKIAVVRPEGGFQIKHTTKNSGKRDSNGSSMIDNTTRSWRHPVPNMNIKAMDARNLVGSEGAMLIDRHVIGLKSTPLDCHWGKWSVWTDCSASCDGGQKLRIRVVQGPSTACKKADGTEKSGCSTTPCPVNCHWGAWEPWTDCSKSCDKGRKTRYRHKHEERHAGLECKETNWMEERHCNTKKCK